MHPIRRRLLFATGVFVASAVITAWSATPQVAAAEKGPQLINVSADPNDWPMYNRDCIGTRHNTGEKMLSRDNVGQLVEKWQFPAAGSDEKVGVVHATAVVNGHVY